MPNTRIIKTHWDIPHHWETHQEGSDFLVILPDDTVAALDLKDGQRVSVTVENGAIMVRLV